MGTLFYKPATIEEALSLLQQYQDKALIMNGGTDAVLQIVEKKVSPCAIIYITDLPHFHEIIVDQNAVYIGGGVTYKEMLANPTIQRYRGLVEAILHLASPPIREVATPAGNICTAAPSADCTTMLLALRAKVHLLSCEGNRSVALKDFFISTYKTVKHPNELVSCIEIPILRYGDGTGYCRLSRRKAQDIAKVIIGAYVHVEKDNITDVSISLGAQNAYATHAVSIERSLIGKRTSDAISYARSVYPSEAKLRESYFKPYKQDTVAPAVARAIEMAIRSAEGSQK